MSSIVETENKGLSYSFIQELITIQNKNSIKKKPSSLFLTAHFFVGYSMISWRWWLAIEASARPTGPPARCRERSTSRIGPPIWSSVFTQCRCFSMVRAYWSLTPTKTTMRTMMCSLRCRSGSCFSRWNYPSSPMSLLFTRSSWSHSFFISSRQPQ